MEKDDDFLDYNIVFNDELEQDDLVQENEENLSKGNQTDGGEFYYNYFNPKLTNAESDDSLNEAGFSEHDCDDDECNCHEHDDCDCGEDGCDWHSHGNSECNEEGCKHHNHAENFDKGDDVHQLAPSNVEQLKFGHTESNCENLDVRNKNKKLSKYADFEFDDETDFTCELDPSKMCDNCGKCLETYNTDAEGYAQIKIDKVDTSNIALDDLYKMYGLDDDEQ